MLIEGNIVKGRDQLTVSAFCGSGPFHTSATVFPGPSDWSMEWVEAQDILDINNWNCSSYSTATVKIPALQNYNVQNISGKYISKLRTLLYPNSINTV